MKSNRGSPSLVEVGVGASGSDPGRGPSRTRASRRPRPRSSANRLSSSARVGDEPLAREVAPELVGLHAASARTGTDLVGRRGQLLALRTGTCVAPGCRGDGELVRALLVEHRRAASRRRPRSAECPRPVSAARWRATSSRPSSEHGSTTLPSGRPIEQPLEPALLNAFARAEVDELAQWRERRTGSRACRGRGRDTAAAEAARHRHRGCSPPSRTAGGLAVLSRSSAAAVDDDAAVLEDRVDPCVGEVAACDRIVVGRPRRRPAPQALAAASSANSRGTTTTPFRSPTIMSPGLTTTPPAGDRVVDLARAAVHRADRRDVAREDGEVAERAGSRAGRGSRRRRRTRRRHGGAPSSRPGRRARRSAGSGAVDDDHVAGLGDVEALVDHQVVARVASSPCTAGPRIVRCSSVRLRIAGIIVCSRFSWSEMAGVSNSPRPATVSGAGARCRTRTRKPGPGMHVRGLRLGSAGCLWCHRRPAFR